MVPIKMPKTGRSFLACHQSVAVGRNSASESDIHATRIPDQNQTTVSKSSWSGRQIEMCNKTEMSFFPDLLIGGE
jgi:hypothetical protein